MSYDEIIAARTVEVETPGGFVRARFQLVQLEGNERPYHSVSGERFRSRRSARLGSGAEESFRGDELVAILARSSHPLAAIAARMHLADDAGVPMHALANAYYFASGEGHDGTRALELGPRETAARMLRCEPDEMPAETPPFGIDERRELANWRALFADNPEGRTADDVARLRELEAAEACFERFAAFVESQRPRWRAEADRVRDWLSGPDVLVPDPPAADEDGEPDPRAGQPADVDLSGLEGSRLDSRDLAELLEELDEADDAGMELDEDERRALEELRALADGEVSEWADGAQLIREDEFEAYARELADDIGAVSADAIWPNSHIDWAAAAEALAQDYTTVTLAGHDWMVRA